MRPRSAVVTSHRPMGSFSRRPDLAATPAVSVLITARSGFKVYTHLSGRYGPYFTKLIAATASEALHVLDALVYHQDDVTIRRHHTDGGGDSEHVFALCTLLGFQLPRIPDLKHRRIYSFAKPSDYPTLEPLIAGRINVELIRAHWAEIFRIVAPPCRRRGAFCHHAATRLISAPEWSGGGAARARQSRSAPLHPRLG